MIWTKENHFGVTHLNWILVFELSSFDWSSASEFGTKRQADQEDELYNSSR
jgi:hypothetical protein